MEEYKKMFESVERDFGDGSGEITLIKLYNIMTAMPEFDKCEVRNLLKALSMYIKIGTKYSQDPIGNSFESVEDWLIKINFEKFLELIEKSLILQYFRFSYYCNTIQSFSYLEIENRMILVEKLFSFIAKDGKSVSMAEFDQFMKKAQTIYQETLQNLEDYDGMFNEWNNTAKSIFNI